jgi:putative ABC transport system permease protein
MNVRENIRIAVFSIRSNLMRSLLTMLGIIIGVSAVIAIITLGNGGRDYIVGMIRDMGQNVVSVSVNSKYAEKPDYITLQDIDALKQIDGVRYVSPLVMDMAQISTDYSQNNTGMILAGTPDLQQAGGAVMKQGRFFDAEEFNVASPVAVIDSASAKAYFGYENPVGEYLTLTKSGQSVQLQIIGIANMKLMSSDEMRASSEAMSSMFGGNMMGSSYGICIPATLLDRLNGTSGEGYSLVYITAEDDSMLDRIGPLAENTLYARHGNSGENPIYSSVNMATMIDLLDSVIHIFTTFIAAVSAISLLVGGIGVMNIMLVSVTERTREIGIRKALGAKTSTILFQFLTESVILCVIGGLIGLALGVGGAFAVAQYLGIEIDLLGSTVAIAVGFSSAIGIFFGIYPARRAARMHPIDALRRE